MDGLRPFSMHQTDYPDAATFRIMSERGLTAEATDTSAISAEAAARRYLNAALGNPALRNFAAADVNGAEPQFKSLGVEQIPFTKTQTVKFRQYYRDIPVYGSIVTVEVDQDNNLVSLNSAVGEPVNVDPQAALSPQQVLAVVREDAKRTGFLDATPRLNYYFDNAASRWRLVYIVEDIFVQSAPPAEGDERARTLPEFFDYVIDAATGAIVERLPRTQTMARISITDSALDGLETQRTFDAVNDTDTGRRELEDSGRNIHTHDFEFRDAFVKFSSLPGDYSSNPPTPWDPGAVSAHANSTEVANFLLEMLQRNGLDGQGGRIVSSVNCTWQNFTGSNEWRNAARIPGQMIYGQRMVGGELVSYAVAKDVVAHELLHGLTDHTARLEYKFESGALNESYSDIFGIIVANSGVDNVDDWDWEMGEELSATGLPMRDMADPSRRGQPAHMDDFLHLDEDEDHGGVHINSGIHNKAAHLILTAKDDAGEFEFDPVTVARLFYLTLSQDLSRTSKFADSRRGMEKWTKTLFRESPDLPRKLQVVSKAFADVGIGPVDDDGATRPELEIDGPETLGAIDPAGEQDLYTLRVTSAGTYTIDTSGTTDTFLSLFGPDSETTLVAADDDSGPGLLSMIAEDLAVGDYLVQVRHFSPSGTGAYGIAVRSHSDREAVQLQVDGPEVQGDIGEPAESDLFMFEVTQPDAYLIETSGSTDTFLSLFGPNSETDRIAQDDDSGPGLLSRIERDLTPGTYFIRVRHFSPNATGAYGVRVRQG